MSPDDRLTPTSDDFDRFEERLLDTLQSRRTRQRRRHRSALAVSALVLAAAAGTAWVILASPELRTLSAYCYAEADTGSEFTQVGSPTDRLAPDGSMTSLEPVADPAAAAVSNCAAVWAIDLFGLGTDGEPATPHLQACLRPDGVYAVFPVPQGAWNPATARADDPDGFCGAVGLQPPFDP